MRISLFSILFIGMLSSVNAAPFQNGSFELGPTTPVNFCGACGAPFIGTFAATYTGIPGWTVTAGSVDVIYSPGWTASDGARSIDLDGLNPGTVVQTFDSLPGQTYSVTFDLASNFYSGQAIKTLQVGAPGFSQTYTFDSTGRTAAGMGWQSKSFQFVASGSSSTLSFASLDVIGSAFGPALDNVQVSAGPVVPEPATWLMLAIGLGTIAMWRRCLTSKRTKALKP